MDIVVKKKVRQVKTINLQQTIKEEPVKNKAKESSFIYKLKFLDQFGSPIFFNIRGEDTFRTWVGVCWSLIFVIVLFAVSFHFLEQILSLKGPEIETANLFRASGEKINLMDVNYMISIQFRERGLFRKFNFYDDKWFKIQAKMITQRKNIDKKNSVAKITSEDLRIVNCRKLNLQDVIKLVGDEETAFKNGAACLVIRPRDKLEGDENSEVFSFVQLEVIPCDEEEPTCQTSGLNEGDRLESNITNRAIKKVRDITVDISMVEGNVNTDKFFQPIREVINNNYQLSMDIYKEQYVDIYLKSIEVSTNSGNFWTVNELKKSIQIGTVTMDSTTRDPGTKKIQQVGEDDMRSANYINIRLLASNEVFAVTRIYRDVIEGFSDIGGISQVVTFVIIFFYTWYNNLRLQVVLINQGVIKTTKDEISNLEFKISDRHHFSILEAFIYGYFGICCCKKSKRYQLFLDCWSESDERTDYISYLRNMGNNDCMIEAMFQPYQRKLMTFVKFEERDQMNQSKQYDLSMNEAFSRLKVKGGKSDICQSIDSWIIQNLDMLDEQKSNYFQIDEVVEEVEENGDKDKLSKLNKL